MFRANDEVMPVSEARRLEETVRELDRLLDRKTMEVEILSNHAVSTAVVALS